MCRILDPSAYGFGNALSISLLDMLRRALGRDCHMSPNTNFLLTLQSYAKATCGYISRRVCCPIKHFVWTRNTKKRITLSVWSEKWRSTRIVCNVGSRPIYTNHRLAGFNWDIAWAISENWRLRIWNMINKIKIVVTLKTKILCHVRLTQNFNTQDESSWRLNTSHKSVVKFIS